MKNWMLALTEFERGRAFGAGCVQLCFSVVLVIVGIVALVKWLQRKKLERRIADAEAKERARQKLEDDAKQKKP